MLYSIMYLKACGKNYFCKRGIEVVKAIISALWRDSISKVIIVNKHGSTFRLPLLHLLHFDYFKSIIMLRFLPN